VAGRGAREGPAAIGKAVGKAVDREPRAAPQNTSHAPPDSLEKALKMALSATPLPDPVSNKCKANSDRRGRR
jgi:hypothetical protein